MRLLLMGPPGAGKGTQAKVLAARLGVPAISTGDIFRANVAEETDLGVIAKRYMDAGEYVPDEVTNDMVRERLAKDDAHDGFLLDGYPRTVDQVKTLDEMLAEQQHPLERVLVLEVDRDELVGRLLKRAEVEGRTDDTEEVVRRRQEVYAEETAPLIEIYHQRDLVVSVEGTGEVDEVTERVLTALSSRDNAG
ncbi:MAG: adenylate kinase [Propionibacteriales bacterium]|nr:adenylate kinase [Propionibacteriales bacterium]